MYITWLKMLFIESVRSNMGRIGQESIQTISEWRTLEWTWYLGTAQYQVTREGYDSVSPRESQHIVADFTSLSVPWERSHDGETWRSEDLLLAELLVHRGITRSKHNTNSERLYGDDEKARLVCSIGQDNACASWAECVKLSLVLLEREPNHKDCN